MEIKRDRYLNLLISKKHNGLIKVITGMRRCGKSYLLFNLFKDYLISEGIEEIMVSEASKDIVSNTPKGSEIVPSTGQTEALNRLYPALTGMLMTA